MSIVLVDNEKEFEDFMKKLTIYDVSFENLLEKDLIKILEEIEETRKLKYGRDIEFDRILIIVESPTKARTIANFFGQAIRRGNCYEVVYGNKLITTFATMGHILDLDINKTNGNGYKYGARYYDSTLEACYKIIEGKENIIRELIKLAAEVDKIYIATDPDAEGEKIAFDVKFILESFLKKEIKRMRFHEVTRKALIHALNNPEEFDVNLLKAQMARQVEDAWIGLSLSKRLQEEFKKKWLSAGRVQSPVLKWITNRYEEYMKKDHVKISIKINNIGTLIIKVPKKKLAEILRIDERNVTSYLRKYKDKIKVVVEDIYIKEKNPEPPFITATLLEEACKRYKLSAEVVMRIAQELFESGLITYHRTSSTTVSEAGQKLARDYLSMKFSEKFVEKYYKQRSYYQEGAHECIRPTKPLDVEDLRENIQAGLIQLQIVLTQNHYKIYDLIFRRFIASQMKPMVAEFAKISIYLNGEKLEEKEVITKIIDNGFNEILKEYKSIDSKIDKGELPLDTKSINIRSVPKDPLYTDSTIIQEMKRKRIGRPSTYAAIVEKIKRKYTERIGNALIPNKIGRDIVNYLYKNFEKFVNEERTAKLLEKMDKIEEGKAKLIDTIEELHKEILQI